MHDHAHPIYLIRHGQTEWNVADRLQGRQDSPLTALGREQARLVGLALADQLRGRDGYALFASPQGRVQTTLSIATQSGALAPSLRIDDARLAELTYGAWDGMSRAEIEMAHPGLLDYRLRHHWSFVPPHGESYAMLAARVQSIWLEALEQAQRHAVLIFTHGAVGRVLRGHYGRMDRRQIVRMDEPQDGFFRLWRGQIERNEVKCFT